jgi:SAM-dependent methyltransferase
VFERTGALFRLIAEDRAATSAPFLEQFRKVRARDGHGFRTELEYRALPDVPSDDVLASEWQIRRQSFATVCRTLSLQHRTHLRILDLGAGNGWLSRRLAQAGHCPVAVDLNDDGDEGLQASRNGDEKFALVQAHFDALPFEPGQFDLVIMNASLHYAADPERTLAAASRMVVRSGALAVMDSPMFTRFQDGEAMVSRQLEQLRERYGIENPIRPGVGFLTFTMLQRAAGAAGRRGRFVASPGPLLWRLRRRFASSRLGRPAAAFGVWATK